LGAIQVTKNQKNEEGFQETLEKVFQPEEKNLSVVVQGPKKKFLRKKKSLGGEQNKKKRPRRKRA